MTINLKENERIDDLQRNGYQIIQDPKRFCFGMDAVLLSGFARAKEGDKVLDMCTGTGIIPILMEAKTKASHLTGLEIQEDSADMARRSVLLNHLEEKIDIVTWGRRSRTTPSLPRHRGDEGLRLLHGLEANLATSIQTPQEA